MHESNPRGVLLERILDQVEAFALSHYLDAHGISVALVEPPLRAALGEIPFLETSTELVLREPGQFDEARELIRRFRDGPGPVRGTAWICTGCGEHHQPEFGSCWNCGADRE